MLIRVQYIKINITNKKISPNSYPVRVYRHMYSYRKDSIHYNMRQKQSRDTKASV
jgi:hypothetical protein